MLHFRGGRGAISREAYPDLESFYDDVAQAYRDELADLAAAGCTYVQLDDTNLAYLCDEKMREGARSRGDDPDELPRRYAKLINAAIAHAAGEHDRVRAPVPRQFQERVGGGGRLRAGGRSAVQRARRSTATFSSTTTRAPAISRRCGTCRKARRWCWASSAPRSASSRARTISSGASMPPRSSCRSSSSACRRSAASRAPCTATTSRWNRRRPSCRLVVETARDVWGGV